MLQFNYVCCLLLKSTNTIQYYKGVLSAVHAVHNLLVAVIHLLSTWEQKNQHFEQLSEPHTNIDIDFTDKMSFTTRYALTKDKDKVVNACRKNKYFI